LKLHLALPLDSTEGESNKNNELQAHKPQR
jgi:hypothetical protein